MSARAESGRGPDPSRESLELLIHNFAHVMKADVALVWRVDDHDDGHVIGLPDAEDVPKIGPGGRDVKGWDSAGRRDAWGSFVGRALDHGRPVFVALDPARDRDLIHASDAALSHALTVPIRLPRGGVLVAGFASPPNDLQWAFWVADCYAGLIALLVQHPDALAGSLEPSRHDGLTGCLSYQCTLFELAREISRSSRSAAALSCCFIDLDDFKRINDLHGHPRGNEVLAHVAGVLRTGVRSCDSLGRYGGDEFVAILPQTNEEEAQTLADRLASLIAESHIPGGGERMTVSIGVAGWAKGMSAEQLLAKADDAMLALKADAAGSSRRSRPA